MKIVITINAKFGSEFQESTAIGALRIIIDTWSAYWGTNHKKTKLETDISINNKK